jgi:hypothetical protein
MSHAADPSHRPTAKPPWSKAAFLLLDDAAVASDTPAFSFFVRLQDHASAPRTQQTRRTVDQFGL